RLNGGSLHISQVLRGPLLCRLSVEVFDVGFSVVPGVVDDPVPMIRRSVDRIELQWNAARVNNVVIRSSWDNYRETGHYRRPNTIEYRVAITCFYAKELVELVYLRPDFFPRLQRHHDELAVSCRIQHAAKLFIFERQALNISQETLQNFSSSPHSLMGVPTAEGGLWGRLLITATTCGHHRHWYNN